MKNRRLDERPYRRRVDGFFQQGYGEGPIYYAEWEVTWQAACGHFVGQESLVGAAALLLAAGRAGAFSSRTCHDVADRENGHEQGDCHPAYHDAHDADHDRLDECRGLAYCGVKFIITEFGDPLHDL